jgi:hypothetical protein
MYLIPRDPALPTLQELFPADAIPNVVAQVAREAAGSSVQLETATVSYIRYRPTRSCDVLWSFSRPSGQPLLLVSGKLSSNGAGTITARSSFQQSAEMVRAAMGGRGCPYRYLPDSQLLLQVFPLDARLPGLALAASTEWLRQSFGQLLGVARDEVHISTWIPVHYKPWRRCVLRCVVEVHGRQVQYFAKVFRDSRGASMVERLREIKTQLLATGFPSDVVVPVAYFPEACMLVLPALEKSEELSPLLRKAIDDAEARNTLREQIVRVAKWLLAFQRIHVAGLPRVGPRDILTEHERDMSGILQTAPALGKCAQMWLSTLEAAAAQLPAEEMALSHGAFRHNQFLRKRNTLVALDLDAVCLSGLSADAGEFLAYLDLTALRRPHLRAIAQECQSVFLGALLQDARVDPRWLAWHRAASHVKWACRSFLSLDSRWPELTEGLLQTADRTLAGLPT